MPLRRALLLAALTGATLGCTAPNPAFEGGLQGEGSTSRGDSTTTAASSVSASSTPLPGTGDASSGGTTEPFAGTTDHATTRGSTSEDPPTASSSGDPEPARALLVTQFGDRTLPLDETLATSLEALGLEVMTVADDVVTIADADDVDLVVISETATAAALGGTLRDVARPTIVLEGHIWNAMGMAPFANVMPGTVIYIGSPKHEIAAGMSGEVEVLTEDLGSGVFGTLPPPAAHVIAHAGDAVGQVAVFAFEAGELMEGGFPAPAARVALGFDVDGNGAAPSTGDLTAAGATIFAAAVQWALS